MELKAKINIAIIISGTIGGLALLLSAASLTADRLSSREQVLMYFILCLSVILLYILILVLFYCRPRFQFVAGKSYLIVKNVRDDKMHRVVIGMMDDGEIVSLGQFGYAQSDDEYEESEIYIQTISGECNLRKLA